MIFHRKKVYKSMDMLYDKGKFGSKLNHRKTLLILLLCLLITAGILFIPGDQTHPGERWAQLVQSWTGQKEKPQEIIQEKRFDQLLAEFAQMKTITPHYQELEFFLSRTLWHEPYIIFQASEGETISDHFLMALDTQQGKLHRIHQGYHARFWIQEAQLYFLHIDQYYTCSLSHWDQLTNIPPPDLDQARASLEYTLSTDLPSDLQVIEWANLHQVFQGPFTQPDQNQLLLISGRKEGYFFALYSMHPEPFELIWHEHVADELKGNRIKNEFIFNFHEVITEDFSHDGCLEVFINSLYASCNWATDPLIYLNFSKEFKGDRIQLIYSPSERYYSGKLLRKDKSQLYWVFQMDRQDQAYQIKMNSEHEIIIEKKDTWTESSFPYSSVMHQDFFQTGRNLKLASLSSHHSSLRFPGVRFPDTYIADDPQLDALEMEYHRLRNEGIQRFVQKVDQEWNPFYQAPNNTKWLEHWKRCFDIIPIKFRNQVFYIAVNGFVGLKEEYDHDYMLSLYDRQFQRMLDSLESNFLYHIDAMGYDSLFEEKEDEYREMNHQFFAYRLLLPLPGQTILWIIEPSYRSHQSYKMLSIAPQGFQLVQRGALPVVYYQPSPQGIKFRTEILNTHLIPSWGGGGAGVRMEIPLFFDPLTGANISSRFPQIYREDLDRLYQQYYFFRYRASSIHPFELEEGLEFDKLQAAEEIIYYGSQHRLEKISRHAIRREE